MNVSSIIPEYIVKMYAHLCTMFVYNVQFTILAVHTELKHKLFTYFTY